MKFGNRNLSQLTSQGGEKVSEYEALLFSSHGKSCKESDSKVMTFLHMNAIIVLCADKLEERLAGRFWWSQNPLNAPTLIKW